MLLCHKTQAKLCFKIPLIEYNAGFLYKSVQAALLTYHTLGGLNDNDVFVSIVDWEVQDQGSVSVESPLSSFQREREREESLLFFLFL